MMSIKEALEGIGKILGMYLSMAVFREYNGKIIIEINCKNGGIGSYNVSTKQDFSSKVLMKSKK